MKINVSSKRKELSENGIVLHFLKISFMSDLIQKTAGFSTSALICCCVCFWLKYMKKI